MRIEWKAIYNDGTELRQYNENGSENKYENIDRSKLIQFVLLYSGVPHITIHFDKNKKLVYRRRVEYIINKGISEVIYIAGWQEKKNDIVTQMICFLFEDGYMEITDGFKDRHPWFYLPIFRPEEKL